MKVEKRIRKEKEEDILEYMNHYLIDSSKAIQKIKEHVYSFINISVGVSGHKKNFNSVPAVISGCKQNLDDLKRIESLLKGSVNSKKQTILEMPEESDKISLTTNTSPTDLKGIQGSEGVNYIQEMLEVKTQNMEYREQIKQLQDEIEKMKKMKISVEEQLKSPVSSPNQGLKGFNSPSSSAKKGILKKCKSQLFQTNKNIDLIRKRNRECLNLVNLVKEQLDIVESQNQS